MQTELFESRIVTAYTSETANRIIERAGVTTIGVYPEDVFWEYKGKRIARPIVNRWERVMEEEYGIKIKYV